MLGKWLTKSSGPAPAAGMDDDAAPPVHPPKLNETDQALAVQFLCDFLVAPIVVERRARVIERPQIEVPEFLVREIIGGIDFDRLLKCLAGSDKLGCLLEVLAFHEMGLMLRIARGTFQPTAPGNQQCDGEDE